MIRHVVIGTAGHVDHGKTALVKSLTGVDTDRFPEEQRRGITIDIGFAPLPLTPEMHASVVDVPGHEDFIRNMVAGATGIDVVLLVVAADEGVMPQTVEHLAIVELLGVRAGVVAITKADLADPDWLELVRSDVEERLRRTSIAWEPATAVSVVDGRGIGDLRARLAAGATRASARAADDLFRMPVDRVFSLPGAGTVVTGTTWSGSVRVGEQVSILPEGVAGRVRSVEVHGERRDAAEPGRRTALALAGVERASVSRGSVAVADPSWRTTSSVDVTVSLLPGAPRPLTQRTRVRLHLGTAEVLARITPASESIAPGETGLARLRLEEPVVARWGDRGVLRAYSPVATIGGCIVADPWPAARPRRPVLDARRSGADPVERIRGFVTANGVAGFPVAELAIRAGIQSGRLAAAAASAIKSSEVVRLDERLFPARTLEDLRRKVLAVLAKEHRANPLAAGMSLELLRQHLRAVTVAEHVLRDLQGDRRIMIEGGVARLPSHVAAVAAEQQGQGRMVLESLTAGGLEGRTLQELETHAGGPVRPLVEYYVRQGTAIRVGPDRYYEKEALERLARAALSEILKLDGATPAQLRDKLQLSRKYVIPLLEWLDLKGFTVRSADLRKVTPGGSLFVRGS